MTRSEEVKIDAVSLVNLKGLQDGRIPIAEGITLLAGGNNSGRSSLLQALAIWEFCKNATILNRDKSRLLSEFESKQGFGMSIEESTPLDLPNGKLLWRNLKPAKRVNGGDGYTLKIGPEWSVEDRQFQLGFGLALVNDRILIRPEGSSLQRDDPIPSLLYIPTYSGMQVREDYLSRGARLRMAGRGLASQTLRSELLDFYQEK